MALERLDGRATSRGRLSLAEVRSGRFPEERDALVRLEQGGRPVIRLKYFAGRPSAGIPPWIEAGIVLDDEAFARELVQALADLLPPGGRLMVVYGDDETERGLKRGFPPCVTPLGAALLAAGCTWLKDWYYPEGWSEGELKLQGNKPVSAEARAANLASLRSQVEAWLRGGGGGEDETARRARQRARALLGE
jgi:hypothetical protein